MPVEAWRWCQIPQKWDCRWLCAITWVLETVLCRCSKCFYPITHHPNFFPEIPFSAWHFLLWIEQWEKLFTEWGLMCFFLIKSNVIIYARYSSSFLQYRHLRIRGLEDFYKYDTSLYFFIHYIFDNIISSLLTS